MLCTQIADPPSCANADMGGTSMPVSLLLLFVLSLRSAPQAKAAQIYSESQIKAILKEIDADGDDRIDLLDYLVRP